MAVENQSGWRVSRQKNLWLVEELTRAGTFAVRIAYTRRGWCLAPFVFH